MDGLLVYNGEGNKRDWYKVFFRTGTHFYYPLGTELYPANAPMADSSKPYFMVGGPKLLIKW